MASLLTVEIHPGGSSDSGCHDAYDDDDDANGVNVVRNRLC